jgi:poly-gamma-glutamate capsule biosynthesis protein CapA/YwtB (metallophosphatase superfamily)
LGVNLLALSNNHSYDMGPDGILATREEAGRRGFVHAGTGLDLEEAAAPVYLDTPHGIVALVAMASGGLDLNAPATASRPGINELRVEADGAIDPNDLERNLSSVREAASRADHVLVYQHNHYWEPDWQDPPGWQRAFARQCVDAGAVAFVGHGAPIVQAVELYEGRPIFYSLGNFIFQLQPDETFGQERVWQSVVADVRFRGKRLASMQLYPIVLNMELRAGTIFERTGLPCPATGKLGSEILERAAGLSRAFGTNVRLADNYAEIRIEASTNMKALKE